MSKYKAETPQKPDTPDDQSQCLWCQAQNTRADLSLKLQQTGASPTRSPELPLREGQNTFSVTGLISNIATTAIWVRIKEKWYYHNRADFANAHYEGFLIKNTAQGTLQSEYEMWQDSYQRLTNHIGKGYLLHCPKATRSALGLPPEAANPYLTYQDGRRTKRLDQLDFSTVAHLLAQDNQALGSCNCSNR